MKHKNLPRILQLGLACLVFGSSPLFAHGENMTGPNGGFIRMPGAFHTEVIQQKNGFKVLLLDMQFKNPSVANSDVKATLKYDSKKVALTCKPKTDYFYCTASKKLLKKATVLEITAMRETSQGTVVTYPLPLKLEM